MKIILARILCMVVLNGPAAAQQVRLCPSMLQPGEELVYKVKWSVLRLGTITVRAERASADTNLFRLSMLIESNPDLVFVKLREYNESWVDAATMMSKRFLGIHKSSGERVEIRCVYLEQDRRVVYSQFDLDTGKPLRSDTLENVPPHVEGPSLFYYARWQSRSRQILSVPTVAGGETGSTDLDFTLGREYVEIDALSEPVRTRKYQGVIHGKGGTSAGLSGEFTGWVSDDDAAVPLKAEMKVLLGSILLELEQWSRPGWNPPVYIEVAKK